MLCCRPSLFLLFLVLFPPSRSLSSPPPAMYLLHFLHSLPRDSQLLLPWNQSDSSSLSPCHWAGVTCYPESSNFEVKALNFSGYGLSGSLNNSLPFLCLHGRLVSLDLSGNYFSGTIPDLLGDCAQLHTVLLNDNVLQGSIPPLIFKSTRLRKLDLGYNSLSGSIPYEVSLSSNLQYLSLDDNYLTGELPSGIFSLPKLKILYLNTNNLTGSLPDFPVWCALAKLWIHKNKFSGNLPRSLRNCHNLREFTAVSNNFHGDISPEIFEGLARLETLDLYKNGLQGEIPETLWNLTSLKILVLSGNGLNGTISERIAHCSQLEHVHISRTKLAGSIPRSIGNLARLKTLVLYRNMLGGSLPPELGNCTSLETLRLDTNFIGGTIPTELRNLGNLRLLLLFNNNLTGHIPPEIGDLRNLFQLALYNNGLIGSIPPEIAHLQKLTFLSLAHNHLTGEVPPELGKNSPALVRVDLSWNNLTGTIPSSICAGNHLMKLILESNRFNGSFPVEIAKSSSLRRVILGNNLLQGTIPATLEENYGISYMDIKGNFFEGSIPSVFGNWSNLTVLDLSGNRFSGSIPPELGMLKSLGRLRISSNKLTGSIPSELGQCREMLELDLRGNFITGRIPTEVASMPRLEKLLLQDNKLTGSIPDSFTTGQNLLDLELGANMLQGSIPCSIRNLQQLGNLNLSTNRLSANIPPCLGSLGKLEILDISSNNFSGKIPTELDSLIALRFVNISFNHLSGKLPSRWIKMAASYATSFIGNPELCLQSNVTDNCEERKRRHTNKRVLAAIIIGVLLSLALLSAVIYILLIPGLGKKASIDTSPAHEQPASQEELPEGLKVEDIVRVTEEFSGKYVIGRGRHGTVYQAESSNPRKLWAVKRVNLSEANFINEMRALTSIRHRNILRLEGYCIRDGHGFIVTEFMSGGSLFHVLHQNEARRALDWSTRFRIASGIAHGLAYLHHDCVPKIIHRDMKTENVLLDLDFEPKIGDFGMAKLVSDSDLSSTRSVIVGTSGYMAPENAYSTTLTEKCDVYSYGVILLEILCRKTPVDTGFKEGEDIVAWSRKKLQHSSQCMGFLDEEVSAWDDGHQQKALKLLELAHRCTQTLPSSRPSMRDVVGSLSKLDDKRENVHNRLDRSNRRSTFRS